MFRFLKPRFVLILFITVIFIYLWWEESYTHLKFHYQTTFENYVKNRAPNPTCPWLDESEWRIYKELTTPNVFVLPEERGTLGLKDLGLVTFVSKNHMKEAFKNCASIRAHPQLASLPFTMFFSHDVTANQSQAYHQKCPNAKIIRFPFKDFPSNVKNLAQYRFKALHQAMAFKHHKVLLSFDTSIMFNNNANFTGFIEKNIKENPLDVTLLTTARHNMFSTIHPKMYSCFPKIQPESMLNVTQFQSGLILWVASENGWKTMKRYVECSLQPSCIAPPGATKVCKIHKIYKNQKVFSGCHRFDQAAINMILYEHSEQKPHLYERKSGFFNVSRKA